MAVVVAHMTRPSTVVRVASALAMLAEEGYDTIVCNVDTPAERDRHVRRSELPHELVTRASTARRAS